MRVVSMVGKVCVAPGGDCRAGRRAVAYSDRGTRAHRPGRLHPGSHVAYSLLHRRAGRSHSGARRRRRASDAVPRPAREHPGRRRTRLVGDGICTRRGDERPALRQLHESFWQYRRRAFPTRSSARAHGRSDVPLRLASGRAACRTSLTRSTRITTAAISPLAPTATCTSALGDGGSGNDPAQQRAGSPVVARQDASDRRQRSGHAFDRLPHSRRTTRSWMGSPSPRSARFGTSDCATPGATASMISEPARPAR